MPAAKLVRTRVRASVRRVAIGLPMILAAAVGAAACGHGSPATSAAPSGSPGAGTTITLYNAQHTQTTAALVAAFTQQTGIKVKIDQNDEDVLTAQIEKEGPRSPADVVYTENSNWLQQLATHGLLAPVNAPTLTNVPAADNAPDGTWVGVSARVAALVYNTHQLTPAQLPTSVLDLAAPQWQGKIEIAPSETDFWPVVSSVAASKGPAAAVAWLKALKANAGANANVPDNETLASDVSQGSTSLALINQYYYYRLRAEVGPGSVNSAIALLAPQDPGYVEGISGAAVLKSSKNQAAAQQFLAFITGQAGQTVLAHSESFEYPIHPGVAANSELPPLNELAPTAFTPAKLGTGLDAKDLLSQAGLI
jgi:iron(III) transport system substrate-binding protein